MEWLSAGLVIIALLQGLNIFYTDRLNKKIDNVVTNVTCLERRGNCAALKETKIIERKMDNHIHNGGGDVKYRPYET